MKLLENKLTWIIAAAVVGLLLVFGLPKLGSSSGIKRSSSTTLGHELETAVSNLLNGHQTGGSMQWRGCDTSLQYVDAQEMETGGQTGTCKARFTSAPGAAPSESLVPFEVKLTPGYCFTVTSELFGTNSTGAAEQLGVQASGTPMGNYRGCLKSHP